jgi:hypothetical protein
MVDISSLDNYIDKSDTDITRFVDSEIKSVGLDCYLDYQFRRLNCTNVYPNGMRAIQTIDHPYRVNITETVYIIQNYVEECKRDEYFIKLLMLHQSNLEYEKQNPPIVYKQKVTKSKTKTKADDIIEDKPKRTRKKSTTTKEKVPKQTAAERKLAAKVAKLNNLSLVIKPAK